MKKILMIIVLLIGFAFGQVVFNPLIGQTVQDTAAIKAAIAEQEIMINEISDDANERILRVRYAIFVLKDMLKPPKAEEAEVEAEETKK